MHRAARKKLVVAAIVGLFGAAGNLSYAASWVGPTGTSGSPSDWFDPANWSPADVPGDGVGATSNEGIAQFFNILAAGDYYVNIGSTIQLPNSGGSDSSIRFSNGTVGTNDHTGRTYTFSRTGSAVFKIAQIRESPLNTSITFNAPVETFDTSVALSGMTISLGDNTTLAFNGGLSLGTGRAQVNTNGGATSKSTIILPTANPGMNPDTVWALLTGKAEMIVGNATAWSGNVSSNVADSTTDFTISLRGNQDFVSGPGRKFVSDKRTYRAIFDPAGTVAENAADRVYTMNSTTAGVGNTTTVGLWRRSSLGQMYVGPNGPGKTGHFTVKVHDSDSIAHNAHTAPVEVALDNSIEFNQDATITATLDPSCLVSGAGDLRKSGLGTLVVKSANVQTGGTWIQDGTILIGTSGTALGTGAATFGTSTTNGTLDLSGFNTSVGGLAVGAGATPASQVIGSRGNATDSTLTINTATAGDSSFGGTIQDAISGGTRIVGLVKTGANTQALTGTNTYTGTTVVSGGTLQFGKQASLYNNTPASWTATNITVDSGATLALNVGGTNEFTSGDVNTIAAIGTPTGGFKNGSKIGFDTTNASGGNFTYSTVLGNTDGGANVRGVVKLGINTLTFTAANTYTGGTTVNGGTLVAGHVNALANGALTVNTGGTAELQSGLSQAVEMSALTINGSGVLDMQDNSMVVRNGVLATIEGHVATGFAAGAWNGTGIRSTAAANHPEGLTALGIILNDDTGGGTFYGPTGAFGSSFKGITSLSATDVLVKYTYYGDVTLDGAVDATDYSFVDASFQFGMTPGLSDWMNGDFDRSGFVDASDYAFIDAGFQFQGDPLLVADMIALHTEMFGEAYLSVFNDLTAVPEPSSLMGLALGAGWMLHRRRKA